MSNAPARIASGIEGRSDVRRARRTASPGSKPFRATARNESRGFSRCDSEIASRIRDIVMKLKFQQYRDQQPDPVKKQKQPIRQLVELFLFPWGEHSQ